MAGLNEVDVALPAASNSSAHSNAQFASLGAYQVSEIGAAMSLMLPTIRSLAGEVTPGMRVLDIGCGLGALAGDFARRGCNVVGIDLDEQNLEIARGTFPAVRFVHAAANEQVLETLDETPFDLVTCTEVIEHLYAPMSLARGCHAAVRPGGRLIISAPFHGYFKNLTIALLNKCDGHYSPLWEGGHIKFFSRRTMKQLLIDAGFEDLQFRGIGRFPLLWMSLLAAARKPM